MNKVIANELLPVYETDQGEKVVDGRELHEFLEVGRDFTNWMKDRIAKYNFIEGDDFSPVLAKTSDGGRPRTEYVLKLDMAKELCMVENNEQGSKARKYFIDVEKKYKQQIINTSLLSPELQAILMLDRKTQEFEARVDLVERKVEEQITLDHGEARRLQKAIGASVYEHSETNEQRSLLFSELHREIKDRWGVASYRDVMRKELQNVLRYVEAWVPRRS